MQGVKLYKIGSCAYGELYNGNKLNMKFLKFDIAFLAFFAYNT